jgi:hypothetical protein
MHGVPKDPTVGLFVANTYGKGFSSWGAGMGFVVNDGCPYDASVHSGLHFYARAEYGVSAIYVLLPTAATTPTSSHGVCQQVSTSSCYDDYQVSIPIGPDWSEQYVPYRSLKQQGWGTSVMFDPATLVGVNFQTHYGDGEQFSFSIDSISFY